MNLISALESLIAIRAFVDESRYSIENLDEGICESEDGFNMFDNVIESFVERMASDIFTLCRVPLEIVEDMIFEGWLVEIFKLASTPS